MLELAHAEARPVGLDHERRDPASLAVGDREADVEVRDAEVRDPVLGAVDDPLLAVLDGGRLHPRGVRAGLGLGQRERRRPLAAGALRQEALLELVRAEQLDRQRPELLDHQDQRARRIDLGDLLDAHVQHQRAGARAPVLRRKRQAQDVLLAEQLADVPRIFRALVDLGRAWRDLLLRDLADRRAEVQVLLWNRVDVAEGLHVTKDPSSPRASMENRPQTTATLLAMSVPTEVDPDRIAVDPDAGRRVARARPRPAARRRARALRARRGPHRGQPPHRAHAALRAAPASSPASSRSSSTAASAHARRWPPKRSARPACRPTR